MIQGIGKVAGRAGPDRTTADRGTAASGAPERRSDAPKAGQPSLALDLVVAAGPPVDVSKIAAIRSAIAEGRYPVDANKIAERMIALDLDGASFS